MAFIFHWDYLQEYEWEISYRNNTKSSLRHQCKLTKAGNLECAERPRGSSTGLETLFQACQGSSFQVAQLISTSLKQLSWSLLFVYVCLGRKDSSLSHQFGGLPEDLELFVSEIKELPAGENSPHFITSCILMGFPPRCRRGNHYTIEEITTQCLYDYIQFIYSSANGHLYYFCFVSIKRKRVS